MANNNAPWFKQPVFWALMSGPILVVVAGFFTFGLAKKHANDMVSDDHYKEGKHINLQLKRDVAAMQKHITAQVILNDEETAAKVFVSGEFDKTARLKLSLLHPTRQSDDTTVDLQATSAASMGNQTEYTAKFAALPKTNHWYVRVEDISGNWRVEGKWLPSQGNVVLLQAKDVRALQ